MATPIEAIFTALSARYAATMTASIPFFLDWDDPQPGTPSRPYVRVQIIGDASDSSGADGQTCVIRMHVYTDRAQDSAVRRSATDTLRTNFQDWSPGTVSGWKIRRMHHIRAYPGPQPEIEPGGASGTNHWIEEYVVHASV